MISPVSVGWNFQIEFWDPNDPSIPRTFIRQVLFATALVCVYQGVPIAAETLYSSDSASALLPRHSFTTFNYRVQLPNNVSDSSIKRKQCQDFFVVFLGDIFVI